MQKIIIFLVAIMTLTFGSIVIAHGGYNYMKSMPPTESTSMYLTNSDPDYQSAQKLINNYFQAFKQNDKSALKKLLMPGFQEVEAQKLYDYDAEVSSIDSIKLADFTIADIKVVKSQGTLIVTYTVDAKNEVIDGKTVPPKPFYRMSVLQKDNEGNWRMIAHANPAHQQD